VPFGDLCNGTLQRLEPTVTAISRASPERLTTVEGEHAAIVGLSATRRSDGLPIDFMLGAIFTDDFYEQITAYSTDHAHVEDFRASIRGFVLEQRLELGAARARRFEYRPPPGWQGRARALRAEWFPVDYPRHAARIFVSPAVPCQQPFSAIEEIVAQASEMRGIASHQSQPPTRVTTDHGLNGVLWRSSGVARSGGAHEVETIVAALLDYQYLYLLRLEAAPRSSEEDRALFLNVVQSVHPMAAPPVGQSNALLTALLRRADS
jgi:hypothetical protein